MPILSLTLSGTFLPSNKYSQISSTKSEQGRPLPGKHLSFGQLQSFNELRFWWYIEEDRRSRFGKPWIFNNVWEAGSMIPVDAEIWSPFAQPDRSTNACMVNGEDATLSLLQQLFELLGLESPFFFFLIPRSQKQIRDANSFAGVNPPMIKLAQGVCGKTVWFVLYRLVAIFSIRNVSRIWI